MVKLRTSGRRKIHGIKQETNSVIIHINKKAALNEILDEKD